MMLFLLLLHRIAMAKDSAASPSPAIGSRRAAKGAATAATTGAAKRSSRRRVSTGDVPPSLQPRALEQDRVSRATTRKHTVHALAVADVLRGPADHETVARVQALIAGASPIAMPPPRLIRVRSDRPASAAQRRRYFSSGSGPPADLRTRRTVSGRLFSHALAAGGSSGMA